MELDRSIFMESYLAETFGRVDSIFTQLSLLRQNSSDEHSLTVLLRELHTLKGSSRMMGIHFVEKLSQSIEDVFKSFRDKKITLSEKNLNLVVICLGKISDCLKKIEENNLKYEDFQDEDFEILLKNLSLASEGQDFSLDAFFNKDKDISEEISKIKTINVKLSSFDDVIGKFDMTILRQFKLKHFFKELFNIASKLSSSELNALLYEMQFDVYKQEENLMEVQNSLFTLRMLPINIVLTAIRQSMESENLNSDKKVKIDIPDSDIVLDKNILELISESLVHIVRNSFSHGIEMPEERKQKGKNEEGLISIKVQSQQNRVLIDVSDDGKGIDFDKIRQKAISLYPDYKETISKMNENDLEQFLYKSGFSTKDVADEFSGRGVGLDVVKSNIDKIKGTISIKTEKDKGTTFSLSFPISLSTLHGLFVGCDIYKLFIPTNYISEVKHAVMAEYVEYSSLVKMLKVRDEVIPVYNLWQLIQFYKNPVDFDFNLVSPLFYQEPHNIVIIDYLSQKIGIRVCHIYSTATLIVQSLPKIFAEQEFLQGVVFDEDYSMVPIVNVPELVRLFANVYGDGGRRDVILGGGGGKISKT